MATQGECKERGQRDILLGRAAGLRALLLSRTSPPEGALSLPAFKRPRAKLWFRDPARSHAQRFDSRSPEHLRAPRAESADRAGRARGAAQDSNAAAPPRTGGACAGGTPGPAASLRALPDPRHPASPGRSAPGPIGPSAAESTQPEPLILPPRRIPPDRGPRRPGPPGPSRRNRRAAHASFSLRTDRLGSGSAKVIAHTS